ncbi:hypothetical protein T484DRAFT_1787834 [Baffinella frigidus]|nr:hypothetical protein T484DRAFT_1787834 [Cryptophyta sp. CCMP2293]
MLGPFVPSLNIVSLSDADAAEIRSAGAKHRAAALDAASNGLESGANSPLSGALRWLARRNKNLELSSEPGSPSSPKPSWNPRRMLSDLLFPPHAALRRASSPSTESPHSHRDKVERRNYSYAPETDYEPHNRCLRHRAFGCSSCVQVTTPLATPREAMLALRKQFYLRSVPSGRRSSDSSPPRPLSPRNDFTHVMPSASTSSPPIRKHGFSAEQVPVSTYVGSPKNLKDLTDILASPAGNSSPVARIALRGGHGGVSGAKVGYRQRRNSPARVSWDSDIEEVSIIPGRQRVAPVRPRGKPSFAANPSSGWLDALR